MKSWRRRLVRWIARAGAMKRPYPETFVPRDRPAAVVHGVKQAAVPASVKLDRSWAALGPAEECAPRTFDRLVVPVEPQYRIFAPPVRVFWWFERTDRSGLASPCARRSTGAD
jgi:hypothetical protein